MKQFVSSGIGTPNYRSVVAYSYAFIAADAVGSIFDFDMTMPKEINLAEHLFGASIETVPASNTIARIDGDICRHVAVT